MKEGGDSFLVKKFQSTFFHIHNRNVTIHSLSSEQKRNTNHPEKFFFTEIKLPMVKWEIAKEENAVLV